MRQTLAIRTAQVQKGVGQLATALRQQHGASTTVDLVQHARGVARPTILSRDHAACPPARVVIHTVCSAALVCAEASNAPKSRDQTRAENVMLEAQLHKHLRCGPASEPHGADHSAHQMVRRGVRLVKSVELRAHTQRRTVVCSESGALVMTSETGPSKATTCAYV